MVTEINSSRIVTDGINKIYSTPYLGFRPEQRNDITCDIYIHDGKEFATNFVNLYRAKMF